MRVDEVVLASHIFGPDSPGRGAQLARQERGEEDFRPDNIVEGCKSKVPCRHGRCFERNMHTLQAAHCKLLKGKSD